jgi:hypothetical protein
MIYHVILGQQAFQSFSLGEQNSTIINITKYFKVISNSSFDVEIRSCIMY